MADVYQIPPLESDDPGITKAKINQIIAVLNEALVAIKGTTEFITSTSTTGSGQYLVRNAVPPTDEGDWDLPSEDHVGEEVG